MQIHVELMIFDFDGTLVSSGEDIANSVNYTLKELKLPLLQQKEIMTYIGDGVMKLIERATGETGKKDQARALEIFTEHYEQHLLDHTALYPEVLEILGHFQEKQKLILTNKRYRFTEKIAQSLRIIEYFEEIIAADSTPFIKPDPQLIDMILNQYHVSRKSTVIIGDGINDIRLAKNSRIICGCYLGGLGRREELLMLKPDFCFNHFSELKVMLS